MPKKEYWSIRTAKGRIEFHSLPATKKAKYTRMRDRGASHAEVMRHFNEGKKNK